MQADRFEKEIRDRMEELKLVPDSEVWKHVSARIEKQKKRRRMLVYWFFSGFVLLTGASIFRLINNENNRKFRVNEVNNNNFKTEDYKTKPTVPHFKSDLSKLNKAQVKKDFNNFRKDDIKYLSKTEIKNKAESDDFYSKTLNKNPFPLPVTQSNIYQEMKKDIQKSLPPHKFYNPGLVAKLIIDTSVRKIYTDQKTNFEKDTATNVTAKGFFTKETKSGKKLKFGLSVYTGVSNNLAGLPVLEKSYSQNTFADISAGTNSSGNYSFNTNLSGNFKSSFSYGLEFFAKKQLTKKITLTLGVDYSSYVVTAKVGNKVNSPGVIYDSANRTATQVSAYYNPGNSVSYTNKYHLIQLPLNIEYQLNKNYEKPFIISAGISPGYMISSNALYANTSADMYYADKQKLHRSQFFAQTGFSFPFISSSRFLLSAGPEVKYALSNATKAAGTHQHLFFAGIKTSIFFK